ncbi:MAG: hypothetical protein Q7K40_05780 [bacterium]|nr:hypothetical protein [bacterium]
MKKALLFVLVTFVYLFSGTQVSMASDIDEMPPCPGCLIKASPSLFYGGVGFVQLGDAKETEVTAQEASILSAPIYGGHREVRTKRLAKDIFLGYKLPRNFAAELGYIGGDTGATSTVTGGYQWIDWYNNPASTTITYSQKSIVSAWHLSFIKELPLNEHVKIFGRVGMIKTHTQWEQRWAYVSTCTGCTNDGSYQAKSKTTDKTDGLLGVGLSANVLRNMNVRFEVTKHSSVYQPKIAAVMNF